MTYLSLALIPLPAEKVDAYRVLAGQMAKLWLEHGARSYRDFVGDDLDAAAQGMPSFPQVAALDQGEALVLATLTFDSREHRDEVEAAVKGDPRVGELMGEGPPFDPSRVVHGGFELLVEG